jgi:membrane protein YdbS with pleckstrin-like domain
VTLPPGKSRLIRRHYIAADERVLLETHPSRWFFFTKPLFLFLVTVGFLYLLAARASPGSPLHSVLAAAPFWSLGLWPTFLYFVGVVLIVATLVVVFLSLKHWANQTYAVTDERLIQQKGIFRHVIQEIPLQQIRDVDVY